MKQYINVSDEAKRELALIFDVTPQMVWQALNYKSDSNLAQKIRNVAIRQKGGRVMREYDVTEGWQPNCQTEFEHDENGVKKVISTFSNSVKVVFDCLENSAVITMNGETIRKYWYVNAWESVLFDAEQLSNI